MFVHFIECKGFSSVAGTYFKAFKFVAPFSCSFVDVIYPGYH
jgi:hypothetical protein